MSKRKPSWNHCALIPAESKRKKNDLIYFIEGDKLLKYRVDADKGKNVGKARFLGRIYSSKVSAQILRIQVFTILHLFSPSWVTFHSKASDDQVQKDSFICQPRVRRSSVGQVFQ